MPKHFLYGIGGLIVGLAVGFFAANSINREAMPSPASAAVNKQMSVPAGDPSTVPQGGMQADVAETIAKADAEPQNFAVQMRTGDMYAQIGKFEKAIEYYNRGLAIKPDDFKGNVVLANAYFDSRQFEEASKYYEKALAIGPKDVNARTDLGTTFVERPTPDYDRAIKEFRTALEIEPKHEPALYYLGIAYFRKGDAQSANAVLSELEKANPASELVARLRQNISSQ
jgi:tetratricopeptide (TPR) repeat protein